MTRYVALLRAVNVAGTGKLPMSDLAQMCRDAGFDSVQTYIASGNAIFDSPLPPEQIKSKLEIRLQDYAGKPVRVFLRDAAGMRRIQDQTPFPNEDPRKVAVVFLDGPAPPDIAQHVKGLSAETITCGLHEIYIFYPDGMGRSKLRLPAGLVGTTRNINTVTKLAALLGG